jgi:hypothetical protein
MTALKAIWRYLVCPFVVLPPWICLNLLRGAPPPEVWPIRKQDYRVPWR